MLRALTGDLLESTIPSIAFLWHVLLANWIDCMQPRPFDMHQTSLLGFLARRGAASGSLTHIHV